MVRDFWLGMPFGMYIILLLSIGLGIAGFIVPPLGVISGSVLKGMALILGASWLFYVTANLPKILIQGAKIKASYGNAHIEIGRKREEEENKTEEAVDNKEQIDEEDDA